MKLSVREITKNELSLVVDYFVNSDEEFLQGMGADKAKLPNTKEWLNSLHHEFDKPIEEKNYFYIIWLVNARPIGHSNINFIEFGETAKMHLHLWHNNRRKKGMGEEFIRKAIPIFFEKFKLKTLVCEPYAKNPAPNKILLKAGFDFIKEYRTTPGIINFPQQVNRYELTKSKYHQEFD